MTVLKVGALLPTSRLFPRVDRDFLAGLEGALTESGLEYDVAIEPGGNVAVPATVTEKIQRLLLQHRPHVVTGIIGSSMLRHVHSLFSDARTPFIVNNAGADPLLDGGVRNPYVFHNSLNVWQSTYALGWWAARHLGDTAGVAVGFHEAGYGIGTAFWSGFGRAGGRVVVTEVTHRDSSDDVPSAALERMAAQRPAFILGLYSGRSAVTFMRAYSDGGFTSSIPLISSAFLPHRFWMDEIGDAAIGVRTALSWNAANSGDEDHAFRRAYAVLESEEPDVFGLLGYETGRVLARAAQSLSNGNLRGDTLCRAISGTTIASPRGLRHVDVTSGEMATSDSLFEVRRTDASTCRLEAIGPLELPPEFAEDYAAFKRQDTRAGWTNPYLIT
jgi:branched-chain amino acid transport system substrate-binding protein